MLFKQDVCSIASIKHSYVTLTLVIVCVLFSSCFSEKAQNKTIRLGYLQNDLHHLPVFIALEKGFFKQEGLDVEVSGIFRAGPEEMSAFSAHELDIGYVGQAPATAAILNGVVDVKFISQVNLEGSAIVVRKNEQYKGLSDMSGKTVAIPGHATMQDFLLRKAVKKAGLSIDQIKLIVLKPPEMIQALKHGHIDAFIAWEPYPSQALQKGAGRVLVSSKEIWPDHPCCVLVADNGFCINNPKAVDKILEIHRRACEFINNNKKEAIVIGTKYTGMDQMTILTAISNIKYSVEIDRHKSLEFVNYLRELGYAKFRAKQQFLDGMFYEHK